MRVNPSGTAALEFCETAPSTDAAITIRALHLPTDACALPTRHFSLTRTTGLPTLGFMDIPLDPDLQARLDRLASQKGRSSQTLVVEAIENMLSFDEWFVRQVEGGIAAADAGQLQDHEEVRKLLEKRYPR